MREAAMTIGGRRAAVWMVVLVVLAGCGDEAVVAAPLGELCGVSARVRVRAHGPAEAMQYQHRQVGEHLFLGITEPLLGEGDVAGFPNFPVAGEQGWASGPCGESASALGPDAGGVFTIDRWPDLALVCDGEEIVSLAPSGPLAPQVLFPGLGCEVVWTTAGAVAGDSERGLVFYPYPDDPRVDVAAPIELLAAKALGGLDPAPVAVGEQVLALRAGNELVAIDLRDRAVTLVQAGVGSFRASPSGRYVVFNPPSDEPSPFAPLLLRDREIGVVVGLGGGWLANVWMKAIDQGVLIVGSQQIYRVPELAQMSVPWEFQLASPISWVRWPNHGLLPDGRMIAVSLADASLRYLDTRTGAVTPMFGRPAQVLAREAEGTLVLEVFPCCSEYGDARSEGPVWYVPDDGSQPRRIAERSTLYGWRPRPDSFITLVDIDDRRLGTLVRVDTATREEQRIDDHVFAFFLDGGREPDVVRYSVQDGERSGVWQARLPD